MCFPHVEQHLRIVNTIICFLHKFGEKVNQAVGMFAELEFSYTNKALEWNWSFKN